MTVRSSPVFVATDEVLFFFSPDDIRSDSGPIELPLKAVVDSPQVSEVPLFRIRGGIDNLLVVPDIWLKGEFFPFQPQRESIARAFIDRKLKSSYPHLPLISRFYTFAFASQNEPPHHRGLRVFFPHEEKIFRFYEFLQRLKLEPRWITSPALLWAQRLQKIDAEFANHGLMLVDIRGDRVFLYFYHKGEFLFSRSLQMPPENARAENLLFEINQSSYLYAQKAKSPLHRIWAAGDAAELKTELEAHLETPIEKLKDPKGRSLPADIAFLQGLWSEKGVEAPSEQNSIADQVFLEERRWRPVQWCGILSALCSLIVFLFIAVFLQGQLQAEMETQAVLQREGETSLSEIDEVLGRLIQRSALPGGAEMISRIEAARPSNIQLLEVKIDHGRRTLDLTLSVNAERVDVLRHSLLVFAENLCGHLRLTRRLAMEDFIFHPEALSAETASKSFRLSLRTGLE